MCPKGQELAKGHFCKCVPSRKKKHSKAWLRKFRKGWVKRLGRWVRFTLHKHLKQCKRLNAGQAKCCTSSSGGYRLGKCKKPVHPFKCRCHNPKTYKKHHKKPAPKNPKKKSKKEDEDDMEETESEDEEEEPSEEESKEHDEHPSNDESDDSSDDDEKEDTSEVKTLKAQLKKVKAQLANKKCNKPTKPTGRPRPTARG
jgi:hypothetical protein